MVGPSPKQEVTRIMRSTVHWVFAITLLCGPTARARTPTCRKLEGKPRATAQALLASEHIYDCCDETLAKCLERERARVCRLAYRVAEEICRRVDRGQSKKQVSLALRLRARSMMPLGKASTFDLRHAPTVGDPKAPVVLVEYAGALCSHCSVITPPLTREIVAGRLKGKVRLHLRPFAPRDSGYSEEANLALIASKRLGAFWPFLKLLYEHVGQFHPEIQPIWARECGMDPDRFIETVEDELTEKMLAESQKEGLRNKVSATPTFFINGRKYLGTARLRQLVDVLGEEHDRLTGRKYLDSGSASKGR